MFHAKDCLPLQIVETRRERSKSALYLRLKKRRFEICVGRFHEKLLRLLVTKTQYSWDLTSKVTRGSLRGGDFNKIEGGGVFEDKKILKKVSVTLTV